MTDGESADATAVDVAAVDAAATVTAPPKQSATEVCAAQLDAIGWGCFSSELLLLAGLGWISDGAEAAVLSYMLPALGTQYSLDEERLGQLSSLLSLAQAVGADSGAASPTWQGGGRPSSARSASRRCSGSRRRGRRAAGVPPRCARRRALQ